MSGRRALVALVACSVALSAGPASVSARPAAGSGLARLPGHFGIGLAGSPDSNGIYGWMPKTGIPFDYAYQYLAGGIGGADWWQTWNDSATFPLNYALGAHRHGYIPVFPYYELLQTSGPCDTCGEAQRDLAHLDAPKLMRRYYADFAMLMKRLGPGTHGAIRGYGRTAIVHVEPDLAGYAEQAVLQGGACYGFCTGRGNDPANLRAAVSSSGFVRVSAYANDFRGFDLALLHLRDLYAPNVLLAFHVSDWASLYDIGSQTDPADARALGRRVARFAKRAGAAKLRPDTSRFDLLFNDVADRDAGFYKYVYGARHIFWDRRNMRLPNFHRWERYIHAVSKTASRRVLVWQIPLGNQYFRSENDTDGHYQDNRAEYFFHHVPELKRAGIIGLLFGRGNGGSTTNTDDKGDGVTNPPPMCTRDGTSGPKICNDHVSHVADDDGGYLRMAAKRYYASPVPLG